MSKGQTIALQVIKNTGELIESYEKALKKIEELVVTVNETKMGTQKCLEEMATQSDTIKAYEISKVFLTDENDRLLVNWRLSASIVVGALPLPRCTTGWLVSLVFFEIAYR